jgi:hypothetical protein
MVPVWLLRQFFAVFSTSSLPKTFHVKFAVLKHRISKPAINRVTDPEFAEPDPDPFEIETTTPYLYTAFFVLVFIKK